ncbi:PCYCGC motif-containing (lipo)protein [Paenibacillus pini]|uniref:Lipoprotein n=1 Tax=Paenibacillus pini JCM 16418 TaxID=1236976 RepID=W7YST6_9BACL|nr:PCYCGC motif-containing (lipo)protein [Paenibacillus pini]GAF07691.1 hypothetical protein JCM16418_1719 [Paenibacillus pini JCM 16418]
MRQSTRLAVIGLMLTSIMITGCSTKEEAAHEVETHNVQQTAANGDLQETTSGADKLPGFLDQQPEILQTAYSTAASVKDILVNIPCYCGCGESAGHNSNLNCFIKEVKPDGSIVWDDHGTRCDVCVNTTMTTAELHKQGKSVKEIRAIIDQTYGNGQYAKPTPTPEPV